MWSSNIGWNADSQVGVVSRRQLLKEGYLAAQHHLWAMQRSSYNVTRLSLGSNGLQCGPLPPPLSPFATTFPRCPRALGRLSRGLSPMLSVQRAHGKNATIARTFMLRKTKMVEQRSCRCRSHRRQAAHLCCVSQTAIAPLQIE